MNDDYDKLSISQDRIDVLKRIESLKLQGETDNAFCHRCGINTANWLKQRRGDFGVGVTSLRRIASSNAVNLEWLETGHGEKYIQPTSCDYKQSLNEDMDKNQSLAMEQMHYQERPSLSSPMYFDFSRFESLVNPLIEQNKMIVEENKRLTETLLKLVEYVLKK